MRTVDENIRSNYRQEVGYFLVLCLIVRKMCNQISGDDRDPTLDNLSEDFTTPTGNSSGRNPLWASEIGRYMAYGLVAKSSLADAQLTRYKVYFCCAEKGGSVG